MKFFKSKHLFGLLAILYPLMVFSILVIFKLPVRYLSIGIIIFAIAYSIVSGRNYRGKHTAALFISPVILFAIGAVSLFLNDHSPVVIKLYPPLADLAYITIMVTSLFIPPPLAYYFIDIFDKSMKTKIPKERFDRYCFRATIVWSVYFFIDSIIALIIAFYGSDVVWGIYCGCITYVNIGLIFTGEFIILKMMEKKVCMGITNEEIPKAGLDVNS